MGHVCLRFFLPFAVIVVVNSSWAQSSDPYLNFMSDPYLNDQTLQEQIFDPKIFSKLHDRARSLPENNVKFSVGPRAELYRKTQKDQQERTGVAQWVLKKLVQHHGEKSLEEAPKESALGRANSLRSAIQHYEVKINEETKLDGGYDLPTNTVKASIRSWYGQHQIVGNFDESKFGPRARGAEFTWKSSKRLPVVNTGLSGDYKIVARQVRLSLDQPFFDFWSIGASHSEYLNAPASTPDQFVGIKYERTF